MPSLNQGGFIEASVRSVLDQDYPDVELLVIDGGSTDSTLSTLEALLAHYGHRLRWVSERDAGPANAINKALRSVRGDIVGWLNSDDLYTPGAISRAAACLAKYPDSLMVYGEAEHVDAAGEPLGRYPTLPPSAGIEAFHTGCFICQPSVFVRRRMFEKTSYLDEALKTAFDFDLWLRCFKLFPSRISHLGDVQARSRLHAGGITLTQRRKVALEGIALIAKHVGPPQAHWFWTYVDEVCSSYPFMSTVTDLRADVMKLAEQARPYFDKQTMATITAALDNDARLKTALPGMFAQIHPDGWAGEELRVRLRRPPAVGGSSMRIHCLHEALADEPLRLTLRSSWGWEHSMNVEARGPFEIRVDVPETRAGDGLVVLVTTHNPVRPRDVDSASTDGRRLAFKVRALQCGAAGAQPPGI